uniref:cytochrome c oxidase subunit II n=1 Tax=Agriotes fuscicollis TaxID=941251 RepID=UPI002000AEAA|nr:cytochrome c oxidase subunit II [Agriotes fuscicollis]UNQ87633.1 cytochrome c oxidase subunit II [Agriotes fuscicollis]
MATWLDINLQDAASPLMEQLTFFHDHTMMILVMITLIVSYVMVMLFKNKFTYRFLLEGQTIELLWTAAPAITLVFIALPSLRLLYLLEENISPSVTIKTMGHQWYWSYEYSDFKSIEFDSYMISPADQKAYNFRLLDVDNRLPIPFKAQIRFLVSSTDVIHSWTVPAMGVKIDANPGRLNQTSFSMSRPGVFFGQCSEICGTNHSFMPIVIESISTSAFINWVKSF